ncbi:hypothetical protein [Paenibacillus polymyxa]|uniref:hypothetical protein n=1 Tax=Paenibacillus polymyxa TaxID=1406 RepID=UPI001ABB1F2A|nr:hypothetical protein [Paenibacillus polymyxa]MBO3284739.1 hypothetical protein [Paenibacillus polymyxa]
MRELREVKAALKTEREARELAEDDYERTMLNIERILSFKTTKKPAILYVEDTGF